MEIMKTVPAVFAVGNTYQIIVPVNCESLMWVQVGEECYYDDSNGVLRSGNRMHKMTVPVEVLDAAGSYTICCRKVVERKPYHTETEELCKFTFAFRPVTGETIRAYHIADAHDHVDEVVLLAKAFEMNYGPLDFLILNGDIIGHSGDPKKFDVIFEIAAQITGGEKPIVYARGNHDTRGIYAENIADYTPGENGCSYFSFRLGSLWGLVMDCGEDKADDHPEYGHTACFSAFRARETAWLQKMIVHADEEYAAPGVAHKLVVVHSPFTQKYAPPFDIEEETYTQWAALLKDHVKPNLMVCGHTHELTFDLPGGERDAFGQPCPVAVASGVGPKYDYFAGGGLVFRKDGISVIFNDAEQVLQNYEIAY